MKRFGRADPVLERGAKLLPDCVGAVAIDHHVERRRRGVGGVRGARGEKCGKRERGRDRNESMKLQNASRLTKWRRARQGSGEAG